MTKNFLKRALLVLIFALGTCTAAYGGKPKTPEIDPSLAISGFTMLVGTLAVLRVRRKKK